MVDETLLEYIKETAGAGFAEEKIKAQLRAAGWDDAEIAEGFAAVRGRAAISPMKPLAPINPSPVPTAVGTSSPARGEGYMEEPGWFSRHKGTMITILLVIILLPLVAYGGYWAYQKYFRTEEPAQTSDSKTPSPSPPMQGTGGETEMKTRDEQRLKDIASLQTALGSYYTAKQAYPKALSDLVTEKLLAAVPADPDPKSSYVYSALGDPALHYSLAFLLETRMGTLAKGLQVVTDSSRLPADNIQNQENTVKGALAAIATEKLLVTDLSEAPFFPGEEVRTDIVSPPGKEIVSVFLVMGELELVDQAAPYGFSFSAPQTPGAYPVQIFAFDRAGQGYLQKTSLTVDSK